MTTSAVFKGVEIIKWVSDWNVYLLISILAILKKLDSFVMDIHVLSHNFQRLHKFLLVVNTAAFKITSHLLKGHVEKSHSVIIDKITNKAVPLTGFWKVWHMQK